MIRIKAYTVIEMLVVMLISSISIGITYTCYTIFSNHYRGYKKRSDELAKYIVLDRLLTKDISSCKTVQKTILGIDCNYKTESIQYEFYDAWVLRRQRMVTDTFHMKATEPLVCKNFGKPENIPGALLDEIGFGTIHKEEKLYFGYRKKYGADVLMSIEEASKQY